MITDIIDFLQSRTPDLWIEMALRKQDILLLDHRNCEFKAASNALHLMAKYPLRTELAHFMSRLAREELVHFEQVSKLMKKRGISLRTLSASRYAQGLRQVVRRDDQQKMIDLLLISAFIEARSCERFAALAPHLDDELAKFYNGLLASEARHYQSYIKLARLYGDQDDIDQRIIDIRLTEQDLIASPDKDFRFHSGAPV